MASSWSGSHPVCREAGRPRTDPGESVRATVYSGYDQYVQIVLSQTSSTPLYEQIKDQLRAAVFTGALAPGEALPSLRALARDLQVSLITVTRAYNDLAAEQLIGTRQGKGTVVLPVDPQKLRAHAQQRIRRGFTDSVEAARLAGIGLDELGAELRRVWNDHGDVARGRSGDA